MKRSIPAGMKKLLIRILGHMLPSCKEITRTASRSLDSKPPLLERIRVRMHFLICAACLRYYKQLVFVRESALELADPPEVAEVALPESAKDRMKRALSEKLPDLE